MTLKEVLDALVDDGGFKQTEIGDALGLSNTAVGRLRSVASADGPPRSAWAPALYKLARERALRLETLALRIQVEGDGT